MADILGTSANDVLVSASTDDHIWGGMGGNDTAVFSGNFEDYRVTDNGDGSIYIEDLTGGTGMDKVRAIANFQFADGTYTLEAMMDAKRDDGLLIEGTMGADRLEGGSGDDKIVGDSENTDSGSGGVYTSDVNMDSGRGRDWYNESSGSGGHLTYITVEIPDDVQGVITDWTLDLDLASGTFVNGWTNGYNATVTFDKEEGVFTTVGQNYQLELEAGDTISIGIQVNGAGYEDGSVTATFTGGEAAAPVIETKPNDVIFGGAGDDYIYGMDGDDWMSGGAGSDSMDGGNGLDFVDYSRANGAVEASLANGGMVGEATGDRYANVEGIKGSTMDDVLWGHEGEDHLLGHHGDDTLYGSAGEDHLWGGHGNDIAILQGVADDYEIKRIDDPGRTEDSQYQYDHLYYVTLKETGEETRIRDVETIQFDDVTFDTLSQEWDIAA